MKTYIGLRTDDGWTMSVVDSHGCRRLNPRFDLRSHSPDGFEWGYCGSGPAQLALALAADALGDDETAQRKYQRLKFGLVARFPAAGWTVSDAELNRVIRSVADAESG